MEGLHRGGVVRGGTWGRRGPAFPRCGGVRRRRRLTLVLPLQHPDISITDNVLHFRGKGRALRPAEEAPAKTRQLQGAAGGAGAAPVCSGESLSCRSLSLPLVLGMQGCVLTHSRVPNVVCQCWSQEQVVSYLSKIETTFKCQ